MRKRSSKTAGPSPLDKERIKAFSDGRRVRGMKSFDMNWLYCRGENFVMRLFRFLWTSTVVLVMLVVLLGTGLVVDDEFRREVQTFARSIEWSSEDDQMLKRRAVKVYVVGPSKTGVATFKKVLESLNFSIVEKPDDARYLAHVAWTAKRPLQCLKNGYYTKIKVLIKLKDWNDALVTDLSKELDPMQLPCEHGAFMRQMTQIVLLTITGERSRYDQRLVVIPFESM
jgi:hypothetical protein